MITSIKKAYHYMQRNGVEDTVYASLERLMADKNKYTYMPVSEEVLSSQRKKIYSRPVTFSIVVPAYETNEKYMSEMIESVLNQTYEHFELIIADASASDKVENTVKKYSDYRIKYMRLEENRGISNNTNQAIRVANSEYIGLLDHDDMLTPDALFENATKIMNGRELGIDYAFVYSDEDKCDGRGKKFFEPNIKPEFNLDLLLSNNYICHFMVMKTSLMKQIKLREEYDGAQDHDIVLRTYAATAERASDMTIAYGHISKVLYHWRCHNDSTASNPESKNYAYEAGLRAVADYLKSAGINANVSHTKHRGFYRVDYADNYIYPEGSKLKKLKDELTENIRGEIAYNVLLNRYDVGAVGGPVFNGDKITGGMIDESRSCPFDGLDRRFSGYLHRAALQQGCAALDLRNMVLAEAAAHCLVRIARRNEFKYLFNQDLIADLDLEIAQDKIGLPFIDVAEYLESKKLDDYEYLTASVELGREVSYEGFINYYDPQFC